MSQIWKTEQPEWWIYFGRRLVEISNISEGAYVLDVGSGRGTSLLPAAQKTGADGLVIGIDNWAPNVTGTTKEILRHGLTNASITKMDAGNLGFRESYFDYVLSGFAYVFCRMEDLHRVLKSGGQITLSSWKWQEDLEWMGELVQKLVPEDKYEDLSDMGIPSDDGRPWVYFRDSKDNLNELLNEVGFSNIEILEERREFLYRDEEDYWDIARNSGWQHYLKIIENMNSKSLPKFKDDMFGLLQKYKDHRGIPFSRTVLLATANK